MAHVFDPDVLHLCAKQGVGLPLDEAWDSVTEALDKAYPGLLYTGPRDWIFNNAGGAMGQLHLLYASLEEYVILFGSPIGTEGHSGRYRADVWDFMVAGEMWTYVEGECERTSYKPGDAAFLGKDLVKGYRLPDHGWMLEYARGFIPGMLPFGLADSIFSTVDSACVKRTFRTYGQRVISSFMKRKDAQAIRERGPKVEHLHTDVTAPIAQA